MVVTHNLHRYLKFALVGVILLMSSAFFLIPVPPDTKRSFPSSQEAYVLVDNVRVSVELANTSESRTRGLMSRDPLPENHGMLFIFDNQGSYPFWMMNMKFNLDIIWMDSKGEVVYVAKNVAPCGVPCSTIDPKADAKYVLEVNAGFANKYRISNGSIIHIFIPER